MTEILCCLCIAMVVGATNHSSSIGVLYQTGLVPYCVILDEYNDGNGEVVVDVSC